MREGTPAAGVPAPSALTLVETARTTLRRHPAILAAAARLQERYAQLDVARAPFDPVVAAGASQTHNVVPVLPGAVVIPGETQLGTDTTSVNVGAAFATPWGTSITPGVALSRVYTRANVDFPPGSGQMNDAGQYANVGLSVVQHLLRGAGTVGAASAVAAARLARDAAALDATAVAQGQLYVALVAYFQLAAAEQDVALLREAEAASRKVVDETHALVEGHQRPRSDLPSLEGNLANRTRAVTEAENERLQAVYALHLAMGVGPEGIRDVQASDGFPDPSTPTPDRETILRLARRDRADLRSVRATLASTQESLRGAEHNTLPILDLTLSVGYAGALENDGVGPFFGALGGSVPGVNYGGALSLSLPVRNLAQEGDRALKQSLADQARLAAEDLERQLPIAVVAALDDLRLSRDALAASSEAVKQFTQSVTDQRDKLREGMGTVIDLVLTEQLLISAEQSRTANQLRCAVALARIFLEMGSLPSSESTLPTLMGLFGHGGAGGAK